ncbi:putative lipoprotein [Yersinia frederiksenii]|uniref:Putative lipoprotein n=1 Tax=Yersinia frederiksenii TaxID=29484 RepID=A0A380PS82_YERFR|nr:endopeptidase [Yersinia frederiksenii]CFR07513.1 putative lipoprotein [Yersinia frederiksenii]SUP75797.1 putative lipoprotein [Yersinia frederiksenii]
MNTKSRIRLWPRLALYAMTILLLAGCSNKSKRDYSTLPKGSYNSQSYTVKRGDTLYFIAWISDSEVNDLARINKLSPPYRLEVGQKLQLNSSTSSGSLASNKRKSSSSSITKSTPPPGAGGCWRWPTSGQVISKYSTADGGNKGIDIAGKRGQPVYASAKGRVVYVGNQLRGYGNLIMIKHGNDFITAYAHNDTMLVKNAQDVKAGQKIATLGSSGSDTLMLHFQIRYRATALDPLRYLPAPGTTPKC